MQDDHVAIMKVMCPVCGIVHEGNAILLSKKLRHGKNGPEFEPLPKKVREEPMEYQLCPEHQQAFDAGFLALVGTDPEKSSHTETEDGTRLKLEDAHRTGSIALIKREKFELMCNRSFDPELPMIFVDQEVIESILSDYKEAVGEAPPETMAELKQDDDEDNCCTCGGDCSNGEGYDGECGCCADKRDNGDDD
jgi:hypothetical protein